MKTHINLLKQALSDIDQKPQLSLQMWERPGIKYPNLCHALEHIVVDQDFRGIEYEDYNQIRGSVIIHVKRILDSINSRFLEISGKGNPNKGYIPWRLHDCHFHTNFEQYVSCPFTCFGEICELLEKIEKDLTES
jgi:hypothetical protein